MSADPQHWWATWAVQVREYNGYGKKPDKHNNV